MVDETYMLHMPMEILWDNQLNNSGTLSNQDTAMKQISCILASVWIMHP